MPPGHRVINGHVSDPRKYPWMVFLEFRHEFPKMSACTAAIINDRYILTAAHCVDFKTMTPDHIYAWNGRICEKEELKKTPRMEIKRIIKHEGHTSIQSYNDIALLELKTPLTFNATFSPVCLPNFNSFNNFFAAGWGLVNQNSYYGPVLTPATCLMEAELTPRHWLSCQTIFGMHLPTSQLLCAGGASNVCMGDSGGPLMSRQFGRVYEAGLTSHGTRDCGLQTQFQTQFPSIFEQTTFHREWILKHTSNANWCSGPAQIID